MQFSVQPPHGKTAVYIMTNRRNGTLYSSVTRDLRKRVWERVVEGFTKRYGTHLLVWFEAHPTMSSSIRYEKQIKKWNRAWKLHLIEEQNLYWKDLWG
ncbi:MAG TPA: GIY-YIG nuclease family protein [Methanoregulaceae archaeon]|nr:GIY-YIG nuclease family protein [Methanoregulaceae archaeon]